MIGIDTNILIWGVQGVARPEQTAMIDRTRRWIRRMEQDGEQIMVPATVVGEYLQDFDAAEAEQQLLILNESFFLPPYDVRCAALASQIENAGRAGAAGSRRVLRADSQIIATAICHGAKLIVTANHQEYERLAAGRIKISDVPVIWEQADLAGLNPPDV